MNKKRIGALLIGATLLVGSLGSFAYFTGTTSEIKGNGENNKLQKLNITNGKVEVSSEVTNNGTGNLDWSYDVIKYSLEELTVRNEEFINANRTPDIEGPKKSNVNGIQRVEIGAALPTKINYTRPGDAIVLGVPQGDGTTGLVVTNKSNLTVKMQLVVKTDDKAQAMIQAMNDAGWVMYINGEEVALQGGNVIALGVVPGNTILDNAIDVRFELPLITDNSYQNATNVSGTIENLDLSQIIEIQATQENNTGWNENGTVNRIEDRFNEK